MDDEQKVKKFKLAYRGSRDGFLSSDFHRKCDNIGPNLSLIKTSHGKLLVAIQKQVGIS